MAKQNTVSARTRAVQAKAELDRKRAERDKQIVALTEHYYTSVDQIEAAQEALDTASEARAQAVRDLSEAKVSDSDIAALCGITTSEVKKLRGAPRRPKKNTTGTDTDDSTRDAEQDTLTADMPDTPTPAAAPASASATAAA